MTKKNKGTNEEHFTIVTHCHQYFYSLSSISPRGKTTTILPKPTRRNDAPSLRHKNVPCMFGTQPSATNVFKPNFRAYPNQ